MTSEDKLHSLPWTNTPTGDDHLVTGPGIGDVVKVEVSGHVVQLETRDGVPGVLVELGVGGVPLWRPLDETKLVGRRGEGAE